MTDIKKPTPAEPVLQLPIRHKYKQLDEKIIDTIEDPVGSLKYDGAAFFLSFDKDGSPHYISRKPSVKGRLIERTSQLPHLADFKLPEMHGKEFHVELYHSGKTRDETKIDHAVVSGILNSLAPRAIATQKLKGPIRASVFDIVKNGPSTYKEKLEIIKDLTSKINKPDLFHAPDFKLTREEIKALLKETADKGQEGIIVTSLTSPEHKNIRHKVKHYETYNLKVTGVTQEFDKHGQPKNSAGAFVVSDASGREVAKVGVGLSRELRLDAWKNKDRYLNTLIQVRAMPTTAERLRHPEYNGVADGDWDIVE